MDSTSAPGSLIDYLDFVSSIDAVRAAKRDSIGLLGLADGRRCLDIGCGTGEDVVAMVRESAPSGAAVGIDSSAAMIAEARRRHAGSDLPVEFLVADAATIPLEDSSVDAARADRTFQHVAAPEAALQEIARVCAPGATVVVSEMQNNLLVNGAPERDSAGLRILNGLWSEHERRSWLGFMLPLLMHRAGLRSTLSSTESETADFDQIEALLQLGASAGRAVADGTVERSEADEWLEALRSAAQRGDALVRMRFLHLTARLAPG